MRVSDPIVSPSTHNDDAPYRTREEPLPIRRRILAPAVARTTEPSRDAIGRRHAEVKTAGFSNEEVRSRLGSRR
jgi:hypothetical protein